MPESDALASVALETLGYALFARDSAGVLRLNGRPPEWLRDLWPQLAAPDAELIPEEDAFLQNFLIDAEACWNEGNRRLRSGPWSEQTAEGTPLQLEATALTADGRSLLLIERLGEEFAAKKNVLQKARETVIAYQQLNSEMQKKEIVLHCVAEDMTLALANIITALRLLEVEHDPVKVRHLHTLAGRATEEQQKLINSVLEVYADDLSGVYGPPSETAEADLSEVLQQTSEKLAPLFSEKNVTLEMAAENGAPRIAADPKNVQRVVGSLLEHALQTTPSGRPVRAALEVHDDGVRLCIETGGRVGESNICRDIFSRMSPASTRPTAAQLRLHFCRLVVENCGGEIGCEPSKTGGTTLWIQLPKISAPQ